MKSLLLIPLLIFPMLMQAEALNFGMVAKSTSDKNFVDAWKGCQEQALKDGNQCVLLGDEGTASPHIQRYAIETALASGTFSALAISVTNSPFIAQSIAQADIPILTFDSPFGPRAKQLQAGYIGTDNRGFGRDLAMLAQWLRPEGGSLCIISVEHDPNLEERVQAVRQQLAGSASLMPEQSLRGEGGWHELERCPRLPNADNEQAMTQLRGILSSTHPDMVISVGHWPVEIPDQFLRTVAPFRDALTSEKTQLVVGVGFISEAYQRLISDKLVHGMVSIDFVEMGRMTYHRMKDAAAGRPVPDNTFTPNRFIPPDLKAK